MAPRHGFELRTKLHPFKHLDVNALGFGRRRGLRGSAVQADHGRSGHDHSNRRKFRCFFIMSLLECRLLRLKREPIICTSIATAQGHRRPVTLAP